MDAPASIADLEEVLRAPKRLEGSLEWRSQHGSRKVEARGIRLNLVAPLNAGGVTLEGVDFLAAATASEPDRKVAMQLRVVYGGKYRPFTRVDWRGSPHTNMKFPESPLHMKSLGETHIHRLRDNAFLGWPGIVATAEDLPVADATPELADFSALITYIAQEFAIENANEIREPPWEPLLSSP